MDSSLLGRTFLAVSDLGTPELETAIDSLALIGTNGPILRVFMFFSQILRQFLALQ